MSDRFQDMMRRNRGNLDGPEQEGTDDFDPADLAPDGKRPFSLSRLKRHPGFFIVMAENKRRHWIWYHSIRDLMMEEEKGAEYLDFAHESLAVTIKGHGLDHLQNMIAFGKLAAIFEPAGAALKSADSGTVIAGVRATRITERKDDKQVKTGDDPEPGIKLVKPA